MIENISQNGSPDITGYIKEVEFTKDGVTYRGELEWEKNEGFDFQSFNEDKDPNLTYDEMLLIDEQTGEV
jgi:hypothetical protein